MTFVVYLFHSRIKNVDAITLFEPSQLMRTSFLEAVFRLISIEAPYGRDIQRMSFFTP